jgi:uncharacterized membrane protein YkvA (DUF1232 family)
MLSKEQKIEQILALMRGEIAPEDINPDLIIRIGYGDDNVYLLNGKEVSKYKFDSARNNSTASKWEITYGDDDE